MKILLFAAIVTLCGFFVMSSCTRDDLATPETGDDLVTMRAHGEMSFKGDYTTHPIVLSPPEVMRKNVCVLADGKATHLGKSTWEGWQTLYMSESPVRIDGMQMTFTNNKGDMLKGRYEGTGSYNKSGIFEYSGRAYITRGTGKYRGLTGNVLFYGSTDFVEGEIHFYDGSLSH